MISGRIPGRRAGLAALLLAALALGGCSTAPVIEGEEAEEPIFSYDRVVREDVEQFGDQEDRFEGFNRAMYRFNYRVDKYVLLPLVIGYHKALDPKVSRTSLIEEMSLSSIEDFLRTADNIRVVHNEDDLILEPGEIDFFSEVFGDRAVIYPNGGHLGNMLQRDVISHIVNVVQE